MADAPSPALGMSTYHGDGGEAPRRQAAKVQILGFSGPAELAAGPEQVSTGVVRATLVPEQKKKNSAFLTDQGRVKG